MRTKVYGLTHIVERFNIFMVNCQEYLNLFYIIWPRFSFWRLYSLIKTIHNCTCVYILRSHQQKSKAIVNFQFSFFSYIYLAHLKYYARHSLQEKWAMADKSSCDYLSSPIQNGDNSCQDMVVTTCRRLYFWRHKFFISHE